MNAEQRNAMRKSIASLNAMMGMFDAIGDGKPSDEQISQMVDLIGNSGISEIIDLAAVDPNLVAQAQELDGTISELTAAKSMLGIAVQTPDAVEAFELAYNHWVDTTFSTGEEEIVGFRPVLQASWALSKLLESLNNELVGLSENHPDFWGRSDVSATTGFTVLDPIDVPSFDNAEDFTAWLESNIQTQLSARDADTDTNVDANAVMLSARGSLTNEEITKSIREAISLSRPALKGNRTGDDEKDLQFLVLNMRPVYADNAPKAGAHEDQEVDVLLSELGTIAKNRFIVEATHQFMHDDDPDGTKNDLTPIAHTWIISCMNELEAREEVVLRNLRSYYIDSVQLTFSMDSAVSTAIPLSTNKRSH